MSMHIETALEDTVEVEAPGIHARLARRPVGIGLFLDFLHATDREVPSNMLRAHRLSEPVTEVPHADAQAFCRWFGRKTGEPVRLPSIPELVEMAREATERGIEQNVWALDAQPRYRLTGPFEDVYLCEWTREETRVPRPDGQIRVLGSIFYPPWLREGSNSVHAQGYLPVDEGFSFVTFRLAQGLPIRLRAPRG